MCNKTPPFFGGGASLSHADLIAGALCAVLINPGVVKPEPGPRNSA